MSAESAFYIGVDVGTGGVRACALDDEGSLLAQAWRDLPSPTERGVRREQDPEDWWQGLRETIAELAAPLAGWQPGGLAVDSTSGTLLLADTEGRPLGKALLYNDRRAEAEAQEISAVAPAASGAHGTGSSLAKLVHLLRNQTIRRAHYALHPADWLTGCLTGQWGISDENNALKLGYDPVAREWPSWISPFLPSALTPKVVPPGTEIGGLMPQVAQQLGLPAAIPVRAGTTDSVAAFLATGAAHIGEGVTVLGSTLALKVLSERPIFDPRYGVYSHRLGDRWLPGGASNSGGAVLLQEFSKAELEQLTPRLCPDQPTGYDYLPLPDVGERFPDNDPHLKPRLDPRPEDRAAFLQGLLEGIAKIEARGYARLAELGAPYPVNIRTAGGGAHNRPWTRIRENQVGVPMLKAAFTEACCGTARVATGNLASARKNQLVS